VKLGYRERELRACAESRERLPCHDPEERRWRQLDTCGFETILGARVPRARGSHGKVWRVPVAGAERRVLQVMDATVQTVRVDMGASSRAAVVPQLPGVAHRHDRFHIPANPMTLRRRSTGRKMRSSRKKEMLRHLRSYRYEGSARSFFKQ